MINNSREISRKQAFALLSKGLVIFQSHFLFKGKRYVAFTTNGKDGLRVFETHYTSDYIGLPEND